MRIRGVVARRGGVGGRGLSAALLGAALLLLLAGCGSDTPTGPDDDGGPGPGPGPGGTLTDAARWEFLDAAGAKHEALKGLPRAQAQSQLVAFLKASSLIAEAGVADSADNVYAVFTDGRGLVFLDNRVLGSSAPAGENGVRPAGTAVLPRAGLLGTELPAEKPARLLNTLDRRWANLIPELDPWLSTAGYQTIRTRSRLSELEQAQNDGVFYWSTHGGYGMDLTKQLFFALATESKASGAFDSTATYRRYWNNGWVAVAFVDTDQPDGSAAGEWHYAVTPKFIRQAMHFAPNSLVVIDACSSAKDSLREAFYAAGASAYCGWNQVVTDRGSEVTRLFFDLLLGASVVDQPNPNQRPFDIDVVRRWMLEHGRDRDPDSPARFLIRTNGAAGFGLLTPTINRIFLHDAPSDSPDYIEIEGEFGKDPGPANRAVTIGGIAIPPRKWTQYLIEVEIPLTGQGSHGDVTVQVRGHLSNVAHITKWELPVRYVRLGPGTLRQQIDVTYVLRGDIGTYRPVPFATPVGTGHAIFSSRATTGSYAMSGIHRPTETTYVKWTGNGSLRGARNASETQMSGFAFAAGNVLPAGKRISPFTMHAQAPYVEETQAGSTSLDAFFVGFLTPLTVEFGDDYVIKARSTPVTLSNGSATLSWPAVSPDAPFNNGGR